MKHLFFQNKPSMWSKSSKKSPAAQEEEDIHISFTDADLNDPSLLAELQNLVESSSPTQSSVPKPVKAPISVPDITPESIEEDIQVQFDDKDMQDPQLLVLNPILTQF